MIKKLSLIIILGLVTTGCSVSSLTKNPKYEWLTGGQAAYGDKPGDSYKPGLGYGYGDSPNLFDRYGR